MEPGVERRDDAVLVAEGVLYGDAAMEPGVERRDDAGIGRESPRDIPAAMEPGVERRDDHHSGSRSSGHRNSRNGARRRAPGRPPALVTSLVITAWAAMEPRVERRDDDAECPDGQEVVR